MSRARLPATIRIGHRFRKDHGDLRGLAASIRAHGLIAPIAVRDGELVAGARRLAAWNLAFGPEEPIPVVETRLDPVTGEHDENVERLPLKPSELWALSQAMMPAVRARHAASRAETVSGRAAAGEARMTVARALGISHVTLGRMGQVCAAAEQEPDRFGRLREAMDRTGRVAGPWKRLVTMRKADRIRAEPPPLPGHGPYRVLVMDPPWPFDDDSEDQSERGTHGYPLMTCRQIEAMGPEILRIVHPDSALWLWTTNHHLPHAFAVLTACGFEHRTVLTWVKDRLGRGCYLREKTEHCLLAIRGRPTFVLSAETTELRAPRGAHSEKPAAFYDLVERVTPAPRYAELFPHDQRPRPGWDRQGVSESVTDGVTIALEGVA